MKTMTILLTDGPYISQYAEIAFRIASAAVKKYRVNIFLYMDALHIPKIGQKPQVVANVGNLFLDLAHKGVKIRGCPRCGSARGYNPEHTQDYPDLIRITSLHELQEMIAESDKVIALTR
jgi:tRNA 2-thiouridine synthesizing protein D